MREPSSFDPTRLHVESSLPPAWERSQGFDEAMAEQLRRAPWLAISVALHALAVLILCSIPATQRRVTEAKTLSAATPEDVPEVVDPPPEETEDIVPPEVETVPEVVDTLDLPDEDEPDEPLLDEVAPTDDPIDDASLTDAIIGLGGPGPRKYGIRGGGGGPHGGPGGPLHPVYDRGLKWLVRHQDSDGRWSAAEYMRHCPTGAGCGGPGNPVNDVGVTGLALLAFLGDGSTLRTGRYKEPIKRGIGWLRRQQDEKGLFGTESSHEFIYGHAIASLAMIEAYGLSKYRSLEKYAQRAVNYICRSRNPYKVWRYFPHDGENDSSVTGWMVLALKSAQDFELEIDANAFKYAEAWFDEVTDPSSGQCGYAKRGQPSSRKTGYAEKFPVERGEAMTAVGALSRIFLGQTPRSHPVLIAAADTMAKKPPVWNETDGSIDLYYWYYASYALFQLGGKSWKKWRGHMERALVKTQRTKEDGDVRGSWDPIGVWGEDGGRVYSTAMAVLCLQVYRRYSALLR